MLEDYSLTLTPAMLALVPVVAAILQFAKRIKAVQEIKEWLPVISIGLSFGLAQLTKLPDPIIGSVVIGLVACGSYDLLKAKTP